MAEGSSGRDAQLGEDLVEVAAPGPGRQGRPIRDLLVGHARRRQAGDLEFLGRQRTGAAGARDGIRVCPVARSSRSAGAAQGAAPSFWKAASAAWRWILDSLAARAGEAFAVGEPDPGHVERPLATMGRLAPARTGRGPDIAGGEGRGGRDQDGQPGGKGRDVRFGPDVTCRSASACRCVRRPLPPGP